MIHIYTYIYIYIYLYISIYIKYNIEYGHSQLIGYFLSHDYITNKTWLSFDFTFTFHSDKGPLLETSVSLLAVHNAFAVPTEKPLD